MEIQPENITTTEMYKLLIGCVVPRPIAFVSTASPEGATNLAPFSFFSAVGSAPPTLLFCPGYKPDGSDKDTLRNAQSIADGGTGEFVINVATEAFAREMAAAAEDLAYGDSEFELTGLETAPCRVVQPPRVAASPVAFECRTTQIIRTNPGVPGSGNIVLGEVVYVHVADGLINERMHVDPERLRAVGRMGGADYCTTRDRFDIPRGREALDFQDPLGDRD